MTTPSPTPFDRTREFRDRVAAHKGEPWAASYLNRQNCVFGAAVIWTTPHGRETLLDQCAAIASACGVSIQTGAKFNPNPGSDAILVAGVKGAA